MQIANERRGTLNVDDAITLMEEIWGKRYDY
jgi:hypothetical protein